MPRTPTPLQELLLRSQQFVVIVASVAYIIYALLTALIYPQAVIPVIVRMPSYLSAVLALASVVLVVIWPARMRALFLVANVGYMALTVLTVATFVHLGASPLHLALWLTLNVLVSFMVFGSRLGAWFNSVAVGLVMVTLVTQAPLTPAQQADWLAIIIIMAVTGLIAYTVVSFIENNLLQHAEDSERLRALRQDALTNVYGRGAIEEELERAMEHARKINSPMSVIVTDIDHFKVVNDKYGHATGDDVLRAVAKRLRRNIGSIGGMVGRWGGEEFIVVLPGVAKPDALVLAERLRREVSDLPLAGLEITASFGVASYRGAGDTTDQLFGRADMAMYEAKRSGRNAVR